MNLNLKFSQNCRLYVIVDAAVKGGRHPAEVAEQAVRGGADVVQLRGKTATFRHLLEAGRAVREATRRGGALFIVNDYPDLCLAVDADGVHLGQDDAPIDLARKILGPGRLVGRSTHSLEQALDAQREGADYIGVGPIFPTPTKPQAKAVGLELVSRVKDALKIPFVAIGGIDEGNLESVLGEGARRVAVVRAVAGAEDVTAAARRLKEKLEKRADHGRT